MCVRARVCGVWCEVRVGSVGARRRDRAVLKRLHSSNKVTDHLVDVYGNLGTVCVILRAFVYSSSLREVRVGSLISISPALHSVITELVVDAALQRISQDRVGATDIFSSLKVMSCRFLIYF